MIKTRPPYTRYVRPLRSTLLAFTLIGCFAAPRAEAQEQQQVRVRVEEVALPTLHIHSSIDADIAVSDTVDAFRDASYVGSLRVVRVERESAVLAFLDDPLMSYQGGTTSLRAGEEIDLKYDKREVPRPRIGTPVTPRAFDIDLLFASVYESNIDHSDEPVESYGYVPAARVRFRNRAQDPTLVFTYVVARHDYSNTTRWDRVSHNGRGVFMSELSDAVRPTTIGEVSIRGSSEDRDISDQYGLHQELELRLTRSHRLTGYGGVVWKRPPGDPDDNAFKPRVGLEYDRRLGGGQRFKLNVRHEWNREKLERGGYRRWKIETSYELPATATSTVELGVEYRIKRYGARFVEIDDEDFLRRDYRWNLSASWRQRFLRRLLLDVTYEFETRDSNDPEKRFGAHAVTFGLEFGL